MATLLKFTDGTEQIVSWSGEIDKSQVSTYYSTNLCAIIDDGEVTSIGNSFDQTLAANLFENLTCLAQVCFPNITQLYVKTFANCSSLISAEFANLTSFHSADDTSYSTYEEIPHYNGWQFKNCSKLKYIYLPKISDFLYFDDKSSSMNVDLGDAFEGCINLDYINLGNNTNTNLLNIIGIPGSSSFPSDYSIIVDDVNSWQQATYSSEYSDHFTNKIFMTQFQLKCNRDWHSFECKSITKDILSACCYEAMNGQSEKVNELKIIYSNVENCLLSDVFYYDIASDISAFYYPMGGVSASTSQYNDRFRDYNLTSKTMYFDITLSSKDDIYSTGMFPMDKNAYEDVISAIYNIHYDDSIPEDERIISGNIKGLFDTNNPLSANLNNCTVIANTFYQCRNLTAIYAPELKVIGEYGISQCPIEYLYVPNVLSCLDHAIDNCGTIPTNISILDFPLLTYAGKNAFVYNTRTISAIFPELKYIGDSCFSTCNSLKYIYAPKLLTIGTGAFKNLDIDHVTMPLLRNIGPSAFYDCKLLSNVFAEGILTMNLYMSETIGDEAFYGCSQLKQVNGRFTSYIGNGAFKNTGLQIVNFPLSNLTIGTKCDQFSGCTNMNACYMPYISPLPVLTSTNITEFHYYKKELPYYSEYPSFVPSTLTSLYLREYELSDSEDLESIKSMLTLQTNASDSLLIIGNGNPGETKFNIQNDMICPQYQAYPNPSEDQLVYLHLCLDPCADSYLSDIFLNSTFADEYIYYINSSEFEHATGRHDYSPKNFGSIYQY